MNTSINKDESKRIIYAGEINNGWKDGFGTWWNQDGTVNYSGEWKAGIPFLPPRVTRAQAVITVGGIANVAC